MEEKLCPECGIQGKKVNLKTVKSLVKTEVKDSDSYRICMNSDCDVIYFNNLESLSYNTSDLRVQVWFKSNANEDVPICYCSNLTRREIKEVVVKGYTTIDDIRKYTRKNITGECLTENPTGKCCHQAFAEEIARYSNKNNNHSCC